VLTTLTVLSSTPPGTAGTRSAATVPDPLSAPLAATGAIAGTVTDESANPIAWIGVRAGDYDSVVNCEVGGEFWVGSQADGTYRLDVPPGTYLVFVNSHGNPGGYVPEAYPDVNSWANISAAARVTVSSGQTVTGVDFSLTAGFTISGRLVDDQAQPVLGAGANIHDLDQGIEFGCALGFGSSDADGTFEVNVPAGTYDLAFCKDDTCAAGNHPGAGDQRSNRSTIT
jgi:hypothetical protein